MTYPKFTHTLKSHFSFYFSKDLRIFLSAIVATLSISNSMFAQHSLAALKKETPSVTFTENKGPVHDQDSKPRKDILYAGNSKGMVFHLRNNGISYQLNRIDSYKANKDLKTGVVKDIADTSTTYRLDVNWLSTNPLFSCTTEGRIPGAANYFSDAYSDGIYNIKTYKGITYQNIYKNIDLHYYEKNGDLKYDFIVAPNTDYKKIRMEIKGAEKIEIQQDGSLFISTPLGTTQEGKPIVFQNGKQIKASWTIQENILSFDIQSYDGNSSQTDPT